jgi:5'-nucleotidase
VKNVLRCAAATLAAVTAASVLGAVPASAADPVTIQVLDINDFHGRLDANTVKFAGTVEQLRAQGGEDNTLFISSGDDIGASLFPSQVQQDGPTLDVLNALDLDTSTVGNHEFDRGAADLLGRVADRSDFPHLAANVIDTSTGRPVLPPSATFEVGGLDVAVVGAVTQETPALVSPDGITGLRFTDPVEAVNTEVERLERLTDAPDVIVASYHEGAQNGTTAGGTLESELAKGGAFADIVTKTDPDVDAIFNGHTHQTYAWEAPIPGRSGTRPVLQTGSYGENVGRVQLTVDPATGAVTGHTQANVARVTTANETLVATYPRVAEVARITDAALANATEVGRRPVGEVTEDITTAGYADGGAKRDDRANESTLGNLVAEMYRSEVSRTAVGRDVDLGIVNPGGLRDDLEFAGTGGTNTDGVVTFGEAVSVLPFANSLFVVTLDGRQLKTVFEQQWQRTAAGAVPSRAYLQLGTSDNVRYTFDATRPEGDRITSLWVDGEKVSPEKTYDVAVPSFLASGGDNFRAFAAGARRDTGLADLDAWTTYLSKNQPVSPSFARHAVEVRGLQQSYRAGGAFEVTLPRLDLTSSGSPANRSVSARLLDGDRVVANLGARAVTNGAATIAGRLPSKVAGDLVLEVRASRSGTLVTVPISIKGATIEATASTVAFGDDATVSVAVTAPGAAPSGTVEVRDGETTLGTGTLDAEGRADVSIDTERIGAGTRELTVVYSGDTDLPEATGTVAVTVEKAATSATVDVEENPRRGAPVDLTVDITSATGTQPTGQVRAELDGTVLGTATLSGGKATIEADTSSLPIGTTTVEIVYVGDDDHATSTTTAAVDLAKGVVSLAVTPPTATPYGTSTVIELSSDDDARGLVFASTSDGTVVGVGTITDGSGRVSLDRTALRPGEHTLEVYFNGSADFEPVTVPVTVTVTKATSATSASVRPTSVVRNRGKATVAVTVRTAGFTADGGAIVVRVGSKVVGRGELRDGKASVTLRPFTNTGRRTLTVSYSGNDLAKPSTGRATLTVRSR